MSIKNDILRVLRNPSLAICVLKGFRDRKYVERSEWFDPVWYREGSYGEDLSGLDPALHYSITGFNPVAEPSPDFIPAEYVSLHPDAKGCNPLVHYEKIGKRKGYPISYLQRETGGEPRRVSLEEHQRALKANVRKIGERVKSGQRIRAVFLVYSSSMFSTRALFEEMARDARFDPKIAVVPDFRWGKDTAEKERVRCKEELSKTYSSRYFLPVEPTADGNWPDVLSETDLAIFATPYSLSDFRYNPHWAVGRPFLPVLVNYSYPLGKFTDWVMKRQNMGYFWKILWENEDILEEYRQNSLLHGANGVCAGCMKLDSLASLSSSPRTRKRVLICPHHAIYKSGAFAASNFLRFSDFFALLPTRYPDVDFVFRPHPHLFRRLSDPSVWGKRKTREYRERLLSHPNLAWSEGGNYLSEFVESDAIVQDCGSFLAEYFFVGKPCCYMIREDSADLFSLFGKECLSHCYQAREEKDIVDFLEKVVIGGEDPMRADREAFRNRVMVNYPHAARSALDGILDEIGAAAPDPEKLRT